MFKKVSPALVLAGCFLLAACGNAGGQVSQEASPSEMNKPAIPTVDRSSYSHIKATFDPEKQTVETPLDKYVHSADEQTIISTANYTFLKKCATEQGKELPHHFYQVEYRGDIPFSVWSNSFAEKYGYEINHVLGKIYIDEGYRGAEIPTEIQQTFETCLDEISSKEIPYFIEGISISDNAETRILSEVSGQVAYLVIEDADVKDAIEEWSQCLKSQGIALDPQYEQPSPVIPEDKEANIRQALIDVQCKKEVRLMERYYDAQAQYEQALIEKNQAAFNSLAERKEAYTKQAKEVLVQNGITP